jgi:hypothetical protein
VVQRGNQEGSDGCDGVQEEGERRGGGEGLWGCAGMQNEEISKETVGRWRGYLPYIWSYAIGSHEGGRGVRGNRV